MLRLSQRLSASFPDKSVPCAAESLPDEKGQGSHPVRSPRDDSAAGGHHDLGDQHSSRSCASLMALHHQRPATAFCSLSQAGKIAFAAMSL